MKVKHTHVQIVLSDINIDKSLGNVLSNKIILSRPPVMVPKRPDSGVLPGRKVLRGKTAVVPV